MFLDHVSIHILSGVKSQTTDQAIDFVLVTIFNVSFKMKVTEKRNIANVTKKNRFFDFRVFGDNWLHRFSSLYVFSVCFQKMSSFVFFQLFNSGKDQATTCAAMHMHLLVMLLQELLGCSQKIADTA